jgi:hypothetical protein
MATPAKAPITLRLEVEPSEIGFAAASRRACGIAELLGCAVRYTYGDCVVTVLHGRAHHDELAREHMYNKHTAKPEGRVLQGHGWVLSYVDGAAS